MQMPTLEDVRHSPNNPAILVVDDCALLRMTLSLLLKREGYTVLEAEDGEKALSVAAEDEVGCVLLDVMMPKLNGYEVCRRLKRSPATAHIPVILVTASDRHVALEQGLSAGADHVLNKPVDPSELLSIMQQLMCGNGSGERHRIARTQSALAPS